ncbi:MAG: HAD-superfamily hydrolase, subfamily IA, variant 3, partial [uncultured Nocardioidaceae bacterium]
GERIEHHGPARSPSRRGRDPAGHQLPARSRLVAGTARRRARRRRHGQHPSGDRHRQRGTRGEADRRRGREGRGGALRALRGAARHGRGVPAGTGARRSLLGPRADRRARHQRQGSRPGLDEAGDRGRGQRAGRHHVLGGGRCQAGAGPAAGRHRAAPAGPTANCRGGRHGVGRPLGQASRAALRDADLRRHLPGRAGSGRSRRGVRRPGRSLGQPRDLADRPAL